MADEVVLAVRGDSRARSMASRASITLGSGANPVKTSFRRARGAFRSGQRVVAASMQGAVDGLALVDGESVTFS